MGPASNGGPWFECLTTPYTKERQDMQRGRHEAHDAMDFRVQALGATTPLAPIPSCFCALRDGHTPSGNPSVPVRSA